jgi:hypothetical protein
VIEQFGYPLGFGLCAALIMVGAGLFIGSQRLPGLEPEPAPEDEPAVVVRSAA